MAIQATECLELTTLGLYIVVPCWHLTFFVHVKIGPKTARNVDWNYSYEEVWTTARYTLHLLELIRVIFDEVDQVEKWQQTSSAKIRPRVRPSEAYLFPVTSLTPAFREVGLVDSEVVELVESCLMLCIVSMVVVAKLLLKTFEPLHLHR